MLGLHVILLLVLRLRPNLAAEYTGACVQMPSVQGRCYKKLFTNELPLRERLEKCPHGRLALHDRGDVITAVSAAIGIPMDCENPSDATSADAGTHYLNVGLRDDAMEWSNGDPLFYDFLEDANREAAQGYHFQLTGEETCLVYRQRKKGCLGDTDTWHFRARCPVEDVHISVLCSGISAWSFSDTVHLDVRVFQPNLRFACFISWIAGLLMLTVVIYLYINVHYELLGRFYAISSTIVELSRAVDAAAIPEPQLDGMVKQIKSVTLEGVWAEREAVNFAMDEHFTGSPLCEVPLDQRIGWRLGKAAKVQLADEKIDADLAFTDKKAACKYGLLSLDGVEDIHYAVQKAGLAEKCQDDTVKPPPPANMTSTLLYLGIKKDEYRWADGRPITYNMTGMESRLAGDCAYYSCQPGCVEPQCDYWHYQLACDDRTVVLCAGKNLTRWEPRPVILEPIIFRSFLGIALLLLFVFMLFSLLLSIHIYQRVKHDQLEPYYAITSNIVRLSQTLDRVGFQDKDMVPMFKEINVALATVKSEREFVNRMQDYDFDASPLVGLPLDEKVPWRLRKTESGMGVVGEAATRRSNSMRERLRELKEQLISSEAPEPSLRIDSSMEPLKRQRTEEVNQKTHETEVEGGNETPSKRARKQKKAIVAVAAPAPVAPVALPSPKKSPASKAAPAPAQPAAAVKDEKSRESKLKDKTGDSFDKIAGTTGADESRTHDPQSRTSDDGGLGKGAPKTRTPASFGKSPKKSREPLLRSKESRTQETLVRTRPTAPSATVPISMTQRSGKSRESAATQGSKENVRQRRSARSARSGGH
ncbi:unnamed protein product, partial [Mesorhabditis spiculigera]